MIDLTEQQRQQLDGADLPRLREPKTNETYVLVRADIFERMRAVIDGYTRRAGWDDPEFDVYEAYRKKP